MQEDQDSPQMNNSEPFTPMLHDWIVQVMGSIEDNPQWLQDNEQNIIKVLGYTKQLCAITMEQGKHWTLEQWYQYAQKSKASVQSIYSGFEMLASLGVVEAQNSLNDLRRVVAQVDGLVEIMRWRIQRQQEDRQSQQLVKDLRNYLEKLKKQHQQLVETVKAQNQALHKKQGDLRVFVKIRPIRFEQARNEKEREEMKNVMVQWKSISEIRLHETFSGVNASQKWISYKVDQAFHPNVSQEQVFRNIVYLVYNMFSGIKCALFCSGQSGSGKSYTMFGTNDWKDYLFVTKGSGIVIRILEEAFKIIESERKNGKLLNISMQFREYYVDVKEGTKNKFCFSQKRPVLIITQEEPIMVESLKDSLIVLKNRLKKRKVGQTQKSHVSSRSHFMISLQLYEQHSIMKNGQLTLLDLAADEKLNNQHHQESIYINLSLLELRQCLRLIKKGGPNNWKGHYLVESLRPYLEKSLSILITTLSSKKVDERKNKTSIQFATEIMNFSQ